MSLVGLSDEGFCLFLDRVEFRLVPSLVRRICISLSEAHWSLSSAFI